MTLDALDAPVLPRTERDIIRAGLLAGTRGATNPKYIIVGEAYGRTEQMQGKPFVGQSGQELSRLLLESGIDETECLFTNVINSQPPMNKMTAFFHTTAATKKKEFSGIEIRGLFPKDNVISGMKRLRLLIHSMWKREDSKLQCVIGLGNYTLWALTKDCYNVGNSNGRKVPTGIDSWRGSQLYIHDSDIPFLPTLHPANIIRGNYAGRYDVKLDLRRVKMQANRTHPNPATDPAPSTWAPPERLARINPTFEEVMEYLSSIEPDQRISCDIETPTGLIACIGIGKSATDAMCIPFVKPSSDPARVWGHYFTEEQEAQVVLKLRHVLLQAHVIGQNFLYDAQYIARYWLFFLPPQSDTRILQHLIWPGKPQNLAYLSSCYCRHHSYWKDEGRETMENDRPTQADLNQLWGYNCKDCFITFEVDDELHNLLDYVGMREQYAYQIEQLDVLLEMMTRGVAIDRAARTRISMDIIRRIQDYEKRLDSYITEDVYATKMATKTRRGTPWYNSPLQTAEIFYDVLGVKEVKNPKTKGRTVDDAALHTLASREPLIRNICEELQALRSLRKFLEFCQAPLDIDNRMRCEFSPTTETFRYRSKGNVFGTGGNLQNIPKGMEDE